jgi:hypothetical protein
MATLYSFFFSCFKIASNLSLAVIALIKNILFKGFCDNTIALCSIFEETCSGQESGETWVTNVLKRNASFIFNANYSDFLELAA